MKLCAVELVQRNIVSELKSQAEIMAIPLRDVPTVEELLEQAKTDDSKRRLLQATLAEMEFENIEVELN